MQFIHVCKLLLAKENSRGGFSAAWISSLPPPPRHLPRSTDLLLAALIMNEVAASHPGRCADLTRLLPTQQLPVSL